MQYQRVELGPGHELIQPFDGENYYCPFCARNHGNCLSYDCNGTPSYDNICPDCNVQPGNDDCPDCDSGLTQEQYIAAYRKRWLIKNQWAPELIERLQKVFQLSDQEVQAIRDAHPFS